MNTQIAIVLTSFSIIIASGCQDPCMPKFYTDTLIAAALADECVDGSESSTGGGSSSGEGATTMEPTMCNALGQAYGPCGIGNACEDGTACIVEDAGTLCAPTCEMSPLCPIDICRPPSPAAECINTSCAFGCATDDDCLDGQVCGAAGCIWG